jgi:hypothetical protein
LSKQIPSQDSQGRKLLHMVCLQYRFRTMKTLDKCTGMHYSALKCTGQCTEPYRTRDKIAYVLLYRIEHYATTEENDAIGQAAGVGYGDLDDPRSSRGLQRQCTHDLPGHQKRQAQSLSAPQRNSDQAQRSPGMVRGISHHGSGQGRHESVGSIPRNWLRVLQSLLTSCSL